MPDLDLQTIGKLLGGSGVLAYAVYQTIKFLFTKYVDQVAKTQEEQSKRIDSTEKKVNECEEDRKDLRQQIIGLLTKDKE